MEMESARFFALAVRVAAYDGVISRRIEAEREEQKLHQPGPVSNGYDSDGPVKSVPLDALDADLIEMR